MRNLTRKQLWRAAYHEAGHAAHALTCIDRITQLTLHHPAFKGLWLRRTADEPKPAGHALNDSNGAMLTAGEWWCDARTQVANLVAGIAGERILSGRKSPGKIKFIDWMSGAQSDILAAGEIIKDHNKTGKFL